MSIGVKAIVANHDLSLIGNMGSDFGYELQIINPFFLASSIKDVDLVPSALRSLTASLRPG
jgi:hypothetical protein